MTNLHISISAESVFHVGGFGITNSMISTYLVMAFLFIISFLMYQKLKNKKFTDKPDRLQTLFEFIIEAFLNLTKTTAGSYKKTRVLFPFIITFFLFIMISNWSGLLPGNGTIGVRQTEAENQAESAVAAQIPSEAEAGLETVPAHEEPAVPKQAIVAETVDDHANTDSDDTLQVTAGQPIPEQIVEESLITQESATGHETETTQEHTKFVPLFRAPTADLNTTLALALFSVLFIQVIGIKHLGVSYFQKFFNLKSPILFVVGILEIFSEISKIVSFAFRLFGNIFAGEVLLTVIAALLPVLAPLPFLGLEIFVGFIQALVFAMLSLVFMNMATVSHDEH